VRISVSGLDRCVSDGRGKRGVPVPEDDMTSASMGILSCSREIGIGSRNAAVPLRGPPGGLLDECVLPLEPDPEV